MRFGSDSTPGRKSRKRNLFFLPSHILSWSKDLIGLAISESLNSQPFPLLPPPNSALL